MTGAEQIAVVVAPFVGAILGGLFGYAKAKQADELVKFKVADFIVTWFTGLIAGGLWLGAIDTANAQFGIPVLVAGLFAGAGFDFAAKKTIIP